MELTCPNCKAKSSIEAHIDVASFGCYNCTSLFSINEKGILNKIKKSDYLHEEKTLPIGTKGKFENELYEVVGLIIKRVHGSYYWREYTLMSKNGKVKYLSESDGHWILLQEVNGFIDISKKNKFFTYKDLTYNLFEKTDSFIVSAIGFYEFDVPLKAVKVEEYICPPFILSIEKINNKEYVYQGEHITPKEVKNIFNIEQMPSKTGVGAVEPFLFNLYNTLIIFLVFGAATLGTYLYLNLDRTEQNVMSTSINFDEFKDKEFISPSFELVGSPAPLFISASADVDNSWANAQITLVNESNNYEETAQKDIEYYHGYTDGEYWKEGSQSTTFNICGVAQGKYHLVIAPMRQETDISNKSINISATWNESSVWNFMFSLLFLGLAYVIIYIWKRNFEYRRWESSDFSPFNQY